MKKSDVAFSDFQKMDFRVGKVVKATAVEGSTNLIRLKVDMGYDYGVRQILSGIARWYQPSDLIDKKFMFVANLEGKKIMGSESAGMIICADIDHQAVILPVDDKIPEGTTVR